MPGGCESLRGQKQITYEQLRYGLQLFEANCIQLNGRGRLIMIPARSGRSTSIPLNTELHALLSFGAAMLRAGATAFSSPVMKSISDQSESGATTMTSMASSPSISAIMTMANAISI
jgi:hypothetical protein